MTQSQTSKSADLHTRPSIMPAKPHRQIHLPVDIALMTRKSRISRNPPSTCSATLSSPKSSWRSERSTTILVDEFGVKRRTSTGAYGSCPGKPGRLANSGILQAPTLPRFLLRRPGDIAAAKFRSRACASRLAWASKCSFTNRCTPLVSSTDAVQCTMESCIAAPHFKTQAFMVWPFFHGCATSPGRPQ